MIIQFNPEHIIAVLKDLHRINSAFDSSMDGDLLVSSDLLLSEWVMGMDFEDNVKVLRDYFQSNFNAKIPDNEFRDLYHLEKSTLGNLSELIAVHSNPLEISNWKFGGKFCKRGTILKLILRLTAKETNSKVSPSNSLHQIIWKGSWFTELIFLFPNRLPTPKKINHEGLIPESIKTRNQSVLIGIAFSVLGAFLGFFLKSPGIVLTAGSLAIILPVINAFYNKGIGVPSELEHIIFPGLGSLKQLAHILAGAE